MNSFDEQFVGFDARLFVEPHSERISNRSDFQVCRSLTGVRLPAVRPATYRPVFESVRA